MKAFGVSKINYWRTLDGAEVDFVFNLGTEIWPIEVKYSELKEIKISRSVKSFIGAYHPKRVTIVNLSLDKVESLGDSKLEASPVIKLIQ